MFLDFLFAKKKPVTQASAASAPPPPAAAPAVEAPGTHIHYHPDLVDQLKADHQALLATFGRIQAAFEAGQLGECAAALEHFRGQLTAHLLKENVRFYIYLEHALAGDRASHDLVHQFRHEMDGIGKAAVGFLDKYRAVATDPALAAGFAADLAGVGAILGQRIRNEEETLYPLYLPAY